MRVRGEIGCNKDISKGDGKCEGEMIANEVVVYKVVTVMVYYNINNINKRRY